MVKNKNHQNMFIRYSENRVSLHEEKLPRKVVPRRKLRGASHRAGPASRDWGKGQAQGSYSTPGSPKCMFFSHAKYIHSTLTAPKVLTFCSINSEV